MNNTKSNSRTKNTALNVGSNFLLLIIKTIFMFITRTIFIYYLGKEALGLNGLFTNVLLMLSLAELGIGQAINFSLYSPLAKKDKNKISELMSFYRKVYRIVGVIVLVVGLLMIPFLPFLIKDISNSYNIYLIYILYLFNTFSTYFISYKETLIIADQKKYALTKIELFFTILLNSLQIVFLIFTRNFIVYLIIQFFTTFIQRIVTNYYITKLYNNIDFKTDKKISSEDKKEIKKNVKAMFFHKIGDYCINGTDNLIVSSFINITTVGLYSNYLTIITLLNSLVQTLYNGLTASLGNLIATEDYEKRYFVFRKMNFISFLLHGILFSILFIIFNDFITLWIGKDFCLEYNVVVCLLISFYLTGMRVPCGVIKTAAGVYDIDKYSPIAQAIVNLAVSIILVQKIGLLGVILGTIISSVILPSWQRPYIVYKYVLNKSPKEYFISYIKYALIIASTCILSLFLCNLINLSNIILLILVKGLIVSIIFILFVYAIFHKTKEYKYILNMVGGIINGKRFD